MNKVSTYMDYFSLAIGGRGYESLPALLITISIILVIIGIGFSYAKSVPSSMSDNKNWMMSIQTNMIWSVVIIVFFIGMISSI